MVEDPFPFNLEHENVRLIFTVIERVEKDSQVVNCNERIFITQR